MADDLKSHLINSFEKNIRFDNRDLLDFRNVVIEYNVSKNAEGSVRVKVGDTEVIVGVKLMVGKPFPDTPDEGVIMVNTEFLPMSNPDFESGPPGIEAIEQARVVDRGIRESKMIDLKKLCIKKGENVWIVSIDVCTLNDDGNLLDASALGAMAALKVARFPEYENDEINYKTHTNTKLPMKKQPVAVTVYKIGKHFFVDPSKEEEQNIDARLTITTTEDNTICALQKGGDYPLTLDDIAKMLDIATKISKELRSKL